MASGPSAMLSFKMPQMHCASSLPKPPRPKRVSLMPWGPHPRGSNGISSALTGMRACPAACPERHHAPGYPGRTGVGNADRTIPRSPRVAASGGKGPGFRRRSSLGHRVSLVRRARGRGTRHPHRGAGLCRWPLRGTQHYQQDDDAVDPAQLKRDGLRSRESPAAMFARILAESAFLRRA